MKPQMLHMWSPSVGGRLGLALCWALFSLRVTILAASKSDMSWKPEFLQCPLFSVTLSIIITTYLAFSRMQMDSITVITSSGGLVNTRNSDMSDLSKESRAWGREDPLVTVKFR